MNFSSRTQKEQGNHSDDLHELLIILVHLNFSSFIIFSAQSIGGGGGDDDNNPRQSHRDLIWRQVALHQRQDDHVLFSFFFGCSSAATFMSVFIYTQSYCLYNKGTITHGSRNSSSRYRQHFCVRESSRRLSAQSRRPQQMNSSDTDSAGTINHSAGRHKLTFFYIT